MSGSVTVGVVANPASGRDIRRLVAGASVFDNVEKGNMVYRFMVGLGAVGVVEHREVDRGPAAQVGTPLEVVLFVLAHR